MPSTGRLSVQYIDYDGEKSSVGMRVPLQTAANFDAQLAAVGQLVSAIGNITRGNLGTFDWLYSSLNDVARSDDPQAQREQKWLVQYHDSVTLKRYTLELPCADLDMLDPYDREHAFIGGVAFVDAFVTAFETYALTPDGNLPTVDEISFKGRNV